MTVVRVVAGTARGRPLVAPAGKHTRPTSDRVREAMFDMVGSAGGVDGARVVDLFAGSGALGIEAVSRGARSATLVDADRAAVSAIEANRARLGWDGTDSVRAVRAEVFSWLEPLAGGAEGGGAGHEVTRSEVVFADPPYAFDGWPRLLGCLAALGFAGLAVLEAGAPLDVGEHWDAFRVRRYGGTVVHLVRPGGPSRAPLPADPPHPKGAR